jgi:hypothetical protein
MFSLSRIQVLTLIAAGSFMALATAGTPARADEMVQNLGPVGPNEPILATVGNKHVVAFYVAGAGGCNVEAVIWNSDDADAETAMRIRVGLKPGQNTHIDSPASKPLTLQCGAFAEKLAVVQTDNLVAFGAN